MTYLSKKVISGMYYDDGFSSIEIGRKLGVSHWIILKFMKKNGLLRRDLSMANALRFKKKLPTFLVTEKLSDQQKNLKVAGTMLYWAEGAKGGTKGRIVDFVNSDPAMISIFLKFLREICHVDEKKLRVFLYCYTNQNIEVLKDYWSKITNIPLTQFTKPYVKKGFLYEKKNKMPEEWKKNFVQESA